MNGFYAIEDEKANDTERERVHTHIKYIYNFIK